MISVFREGVVDPSLLKWYVDDSRPFTTIVHEGREREVMAWLELNCPTATIVVVFDHVRAAKLRYKYPEPPFCAKVYVDSDTQAVAVKLRFG